MLKTVPWGTDGWLLPVFVEECKFKLQKKLFDWIFYLLVAFVFLSNVGYPRIFLSTFCNWKFGIRYLTEKNWAGVSGGKFVWISRKIGTVGTFWELCLIKFPLPTTKPELFIMANFHCENFVNWDLGRRYSAVFRKISLKLKKNHTYRSACLVFKSYDILFTEIPRRFRINGNSSFWIESQVLFWTYTFREAKSYQKVEKFSFSSNYLKGDDLFQLGEKGTVLGKWTIIFQKSSKFTE